MSISDRDAAPLARRRLLVVEDTAIIAFKLAEVLGQAGATVVGPIATLRAALDVINQRKPLDAALIDVDLRGEPAFPLCERLSELGIRFMLVTGYELAALPTPWSASMAIRKPFQSADLIHAVLALLAAPRPTAARTGLGARGNEDERRSAESIRDGRNLIMESRILIEDSKELRSRERGGA